MAELAFVMSPDQNWFFKELVGATREELGRQGFASSLHFGEFPEPRADRVYVVVPPHEYVRLEGESALPPEEALERTIFICAEQPQTVHFRDNLDLAGRAGATFDINPRSIPFYRRAGILAKPLRVGYTPRWDHFDESRDRYIDVLFMGCESERRSRLLASSGRILSRRAHHIQLSDNTTSNPGSSTTFLTDEKWSLLANAKILINLHQHEEPYFEWLRALDAIHCGAVIVSEHSAGIAPLVPGRHLFVGNGESLALIADALLKDPERLATVRKEAHDHIRGSLPFAASVAQLAGAAQRLAMRAGLPDRALVRRRDPRPSPQDPFLPPPRSAGMEAALRSQLKDLRLDLLDMRREVARFEQTLAADGRPPPPTVRVRETRAWRARRDATVTVLTALHNHADLIGETLDSVAWSAYRDFEVVVVDDGSTDGSRAAAAAWMQRHEDVAALLVAHPVNRGLGAARNTALDFARGRLCLVLDSDNQIYPRCMAALTLALDEHPEATFAYPMLEAFGDVEAQVARGGSPLMNAFGWDEQRFRKGNYIDALALIRADELRELGGYTTERTLYGWEDYDLWCRIAERGGHGRLVPQILGRYRAWAESMLSITNLSVGSAQAAIAERHPRIMKGLAPS